MKNFRIALYVTALILSLSLWNRWQEANRPAPTANIPSVSAIENTGTPSASGAVESQKAQTIRVKTDVLDLGIYPVGGEIRHAHLLTYFEDKKTQQPFALLKEDNPAKFVYKSGINGEGAPFAHSNYQFEQQDYQLTGDTLTVPAVWEKDGIKVTKTFIFKKGRFDFEAHQTVENNSGKDFIGFAYDAFDFGSPRGASGFGQVATFTGGVFSNPDDRYRKIDLDEMQRRIQSNVSDTGWVALIQHYFLGAIIPENGKKRLFFTNQSGNDHVIGASGETITIKNGESHTFKSTIYIGPKTQKELQAIAPDLDKTVDYGFFFMIAQPMFKVLNWIYAVLGNWGWAIIVMTLIIKGLFFVPSAWAYKSMAKMRKLAPEMELLKKRYGEDRQAMSQAMMELYKKEQVNPMSGCLPMLLQIPFFLAFYWVLVESVELRQASWLGWVQDLSAMDPLFILPVINAGLMYFQQKLNPPPTDPTQAKVMQMLPLIFGFMFMWFPSGLVLYWTVSNAFSIVQQYIMNKRYGENTAK